MKDYEAETLRKIADLRYQRELHKVKALLAEEARLRQDFARISQSARVAADLSMRAVGADHTWELWLAQKQENTNTRLAQVLAQKMQVMDDVRAAFGQQTVLADLSQRIRRDRLRQQANAKLEGICATPVSDILPHNVDNQDV